MSHPTSIAEVIAAEGGEVTFGRFMELALTHPTLGYYSQSDRLLGRRGDFSTAPALSPFFNRTLARLVTELLDAGLGIDGDAARSGEPGGGATAATGLPPSLVELGGGEGHLAAGVLRFWEQERPELRGRVRYRILEVGAGLRERQAEAVAEAVTTGWDIGWGATLEKACAGTRPVVMVGNEFLDALPVHLVRVTGSEVAELHVRPALGGGLEETWGPLSQPAADEVRRLFGTVDPRRLQSLTSDGFIEVFPGLGAFMRRVARAMPAGSLVSVDYGEWLPGVAKAGDLEESGGQTRRRRSIRGYFKHQLVRDPLARPGRQDLTADVDFAAVDLHGCREGFETVVFTTLATFLQAGGAEAELERLTASDVEADALESDRQSTVLCGLLDQGDLGRAFKLMVQVREEV